MKNFIKQAPKYQSSLIIGTEIQRRSILKRIFHLKPPAIAIGEHSYPLLLKGGAGSGKSTLILELLTHNLKDRQPFIYINGRNVHCQHDKILKIAQTYGHEKHLYFLNGHATNRSETNSFDPITPLIGNDEAFTVLFGKPLGPLINKILICQREAGLSLTFDALKDLLDLSYWKGLVNDIRYQKALPDLIEYLNQITVIPASEVTLHTWNTVKLANFLVVTERSPMCSFSPDVDFSEIYKEKRFLVISMAGYPTQKLDYQVLSSLLVILMAHAAPTLPKNSIHPSMVFEHTFSSCPVSGKILDSFADTSSLFVCDCTPEGDDCTYFHQVFNMARVFLQLKSEDPFPLPFGHSVHNAGIRIHRRDIMSQRPGECIAWGGLLKFSSGKSKKIEGTCRIKLHNQHE